jgi:hypothetical protein
MAAVNHRRRALGIPMFHPRHLSALMMMAFFEILPSERAIAARCDESIAIREFLHYD